MKIKLMHVSGVEESLFGLGLSFGLTSPYESWLDVPVDVRSRLHDVARNLCVKDGGHNKFIRQIYYVWDIAAPSYWWPQFDQYKIGTVTQSESKMHSLLKRPFTPEDFDGYDFAVETLNSMREDYISMEAGREKKELWDEILHTLPMCYVQRRVCSMNLAVMKNIYHQRWLHRLGEWKTVCDAFVESTPLFLRGIYGQN